MNSTEERFTRSDVEIAIEEAIDSYTLRLMVAGSKKPDLLIQSYKRLYESGKILKKDLLDRVIWKIITREEYNYITGQEV